MNWEELQHEATEDLIEFIKSRKADSDYAELAEAAFIAFTFRFRKDLVNKCVVMVRKWQRSDDDAIELANRVFARFYKYPKYDKAQCKGGIVDDCVRYYLHGIASKEIIGLLKPKDTPYDGSEEVVTSIVKDEANHTVEDLKVLNEYQVRLDKIFEKLTVKHKIIFLTYKQYEQEGRQLPRELLAELRDSLKLSQNSIRVYKKEAIELVNRELGNG